MGRFSFTVMAQGGCNSSSLWNILTDGNSRIDSQLNIFKNMDDFYAVREGGSQVGAEAGEFHEVCPGKKFKLKPKAGSSEMKLDTNFF